MNEMNKKIATINYNNEGEMVSIECGNNQDGDFQMLVLSYDPLETTDQQLLKRNNMVREFIRANRITDVKDRQNEIFHGIPLESAVSYLENLDSYL
tara:strand:- start:255 stop:542 length:288 start_codon:yes stop_codon:yes gene_type:complete